MDKIVHFEIPADDWDRAKKFYAEVFGWKAMDLKDPQGNLMYVMLRAAETDDQNMVVDKGAINGGLFKRTKEDVVPRADISVDSIEDSMKKIEALGGKILTAPMPMPNGRFVKFEDSEGNVMGMMDNKKM